MKSSSTPNGGLALTLPALVVLVVLTTPVRAGWTVTPRGTATLTPGLLSNIRELSGVTYFGPQPGGLERFAAIQDENRRIVVFDVAFSTNGSVLSANAVQSVTLSSGGPDFEGIVWTDAARDSVFVSEENTPAVREFDLSTGEALQTVMLPTVYANSRANRSLESLARSSDGDTMWTANEEALTVDGPEAGPGQGTVVRLQQLVDVANSVALASQFAYVVDPLHAGSGSGEDRSGLVDLVMLPDDTLLALERSAAIALPPFRSRIYEIDLLGATEIGGGEYSAGLTDTSYTPVGKRLLWSGTVGTLTNGNFEGLSLGPALANGNWVLLGVLDNGGSGESLLASFELSRTGCLLAGDYNCSGAVDLGDYTLWKNTYGREGVAAADGNGDGRVDAGDYVAWRNALAVSGSGQANAAAPEPASCLLLLLGAAHCRRRRRSNAA